MIGGEARPGRPRVSHLAATEYGSSLAAPGRADMCACDWIPGRAPSRRIRPEAAEPPGRSQGSAERAGWPVRQHGQGWLPDDSVVSASTWVSLVTAAAGLIADLAGLIGTILARRWAVEDRAALWQREDTLRWHQDRLRLYA